MSEISLIGEWHTKNGGRVNVIVRSETFKLYYGNTKITTLNLESHSFPLVWDEGGNEVTGVEGWDLKERVREIRPGNW